MTRKDYLKQWRKANKDRVRKVNAAWKESNPERVKKIRDKYREKCKNTGVCIDCQKNVSSSLSKSGRCKNCLEVNKKSAQKVRNISRLSDVCMRCKQSKETGVLICQNCKKEKSEKNRALKLEIYDAYGGRFCACCGENREPFLSLDHINGDGGKDRREFGRNRSALYTRLKKSSFPPGFQVLCMSCNFAKKDGIECPHGRENRFVLTTSGHIGDKVGVLNVEKAAVALGKICRYAGNCRTFWSVLQHSLVVNELAPERIKLLALVHDISETAISDIPSPFKVPELENIEKRIQARLYESLGLHPLEQDLRDLKIADRRALIGETWTIAMDELRDFFPDRDAEAEAIVMKQVHQFSPIDSIQSDGKCVIEFIRRFRNLQRRQNGNS